MSNQEIRNNRIDNIYRLVEQTNKNLDRIKELLKNLDKDDQKDLYRDIPGVTGTFDGVSLVTAEGEKLEVPSNYAAKSRLVFGDTLKLIEEDGSKVFKQIEKVERKKVAGVLTKKEGKWYIISDSGTFKISDTAADFQHAELNDEAVAFIPLANLNSPYAALDSVNKKSSATQPLTVKVEKKESPKVEAKPATPKTVIEPAVEKRPSPVSRPSLPPRPKSRRPEGRSESRFDSRTDKKREYVADIVHKNDTVVAKKSTTIEPTSTTKTISLDEDDLR